ncbi:MULTISPECIES: hypothetical protein [Nitrospirillum]|uniref:Uncharacterized protein n=1 Tax=Nitrospirillum amazonense TaxID=28077 RepID=A0A560FKW7_9PROT|nr:hypothetical protein [Nitrospirillum amazonense]MEC4590857.1 hypothetical protein [Nitrospirillum amazonense]TWB22240.1 hypothetical protein FBZ88_11670 [Nitrospirillum amazonense]
MHIPAAFPLNPPSTVTQAEEDSPTLPLGTSPGISSRPGDAVHLLREERMPLAGVPDCVARTYAVVHRRHGVYTHIYTVLESRQQARRITHLRRVLDGEQLAAARAWVLAGRHLGRLAF